MITTHLFHFFLNGDVTTTGFGGFGEADFLRKQRQQIKKLQAIRKDDEEALALILAMMRRRKL